jgi:uncharacterized protein
LVALGGSDSVTVRPAAPGDWPAILALNAEGAPGVSPLDPHELSRLAAAAAFFHVAPGDDEPVAYIRAFAPDADYDGEEFVWFRTHVPNSLYVDQVAVARSARRRGLARGLYAAAAAYALEHGLTALTCEVNLQPPNPASLRFHERLGFQELARLETVDGRTVSLRSTESALLLEAARAAAGPAGA